MSNYNNYFNQESGTTQPQGSDPSNPTIIYHVKVSGDSAAATYMAQLVKLAGVETINLQTGDINVKLDSTGTNYDSVRVGDGTDLWAINSDGSGKISGSTSIYNSGGTTSVNVFSNNALKISGTTQIGDGTRSVDVLTNNSLRISGFTNLSDGTNTAEIINSSLKVHGIGTKPQVKITTSADTPTYKIGSILNSGGTLMETFIVLQSSSVSSWCIGGRGTKSTTGSTEINVDCHLFSSASTISADKLLYTPAINELDHYIGTISFSSWKGLSNRAVSDGSTETPILLASKGQTNTLVHAAFVLRNAYVRPASEVFTFSLDVDQQ